MSPGSVANELLTQAQDLVNNNNDNNNKARLTKAISLLEQAATTLETKKAGSSEEDTRDQSLEIALLQMEISNAQQDYNALLKHSTEASALAENFLASSPQKNNHNTKYKNPTKAYRLKNALALGCIGLALYKQHEFEQAIEPLQQSLQILMEENPTKPKFQNQKQIVSDALQQCQYQIPPPLIKFPRTTHLFNMGSATSDDLVLPSIGPSLLNGETQFIIEEKTDGANLGISLSPQGDQLLVQNRSHFISAGDHAQYSRVTEWVALHEEALRTLLVDNESGNRRILYGEWCVARHSIPYQKLPDYFIAFDLYDVARQQFLSRQRFHQLLQGTGIVVAPTIGTRTFGPYGGAGNKVQKQFQQEIERLLESTSRFRTDGGTLEGIVLRIDGGDGWLAQRYKIVRPDFIAGCGDGHWSRRAIEKQRVDFEFRDEYEALCYPFATATATATAPEKVVDGSTSSSDDDESRERSPTRGAGAKKKKKKKKNDTTNKNNKSKQQRIPRCVMMMGLPGSGKSTFSQRLAESGEWLLVNQDTMGKKEALKQAGRASRKQRVIVDRCFPTQRERQEWIDVLHTPAASDVALVCFEMPVEDCIVRVKNRVNHPCIAANTGETTVRRVANLLEPVGLEERKQCFGVYEVVTSHQEADDLLRRWGVDVP